jgi:hypothetical protein
MGGHRISPRRRLWRDWCASSGPMLDRRQGLRRPGRCACRSAGAVARIRAARWPAGRLAASAPVLGLRDVVVVKCWGDMRVGGGDRQLPRLRSCCSPHSCGRSAYVCACSRSRLFELMDAIRDQAVRGVSPIAAIRAVRPRPRAKRCSSAWATSCARRLRDACRERAHRRGERSQPAPGVAAEPASTGAADGPPR